MATTREARGLFHAFPRGNVQGRALLIVTGLLVALGTVAVASASEGQSAANGASSFSIIVHDLAYLTLGMFAFYVAARVRLERLVHRAPALIVSGLAMLAAVMVVGVSANGGKRWLNLHLIFLQPSELFKLFTVLFLAWLVQHHHDELNNWRQLAVWTVPVWLGAGLIVLEPDIGTSSVVLIIAVSILAVAGLSRYLLTRVIGLGVIAMVGYMFAKPYSARRFFSFLHPNSDLQGAGYQLLQSRIGLGSGGLTGLGLGHSRAKWGILPNPHTDFIFTIFGEELGFIGAMVVLALFVAFLFAALAIARRCSNQVYRLVAVGIATWITVEALINVASVVGWWAVTGIPLPFFSYGGTALISELAAVGLLYNVAHDQSRSSDLTIREYRLTNFRETIERPRTRPRVASHPYAPPRPTRREY
ncbi:MAG: FtsW/RodA/SpoVE family cell cycle protein [Acidobacteriota bacterium]|nr:FtsW/RodA/SpoVE family cell cycle protein [Acidobacteriota bacterium]MDE3043715.1 FtsW/RodA/SpoVE family cell cycle protein [Acidobacteriota bacterium]MDE3107138.1 FtsW/RodA/SpoVE family cell cycle protein [Acidobacteriota bacterium]MDE3223361.1 FtsW/RodA/SpoVE family cell cycle protein [Acidobacteriota bacterium]